MALAFVECMHKMNGPSQIIMTGGERTKRIVRYLRNCAEQKIQILNVNFLVAVGDAFNSMADRMGKALRP